MFSKIERDIKKLRTAYEEMKKQLSETRRMAREMEEEKNEEIQNLRDQLYSQSMSTCPPVTPYASFPGEGYSKHPSPPSQPSLSVQPIARSGFSTSRPIEQNLQHGACNDIKVVESHSYSDGPEHPQTFPSKQITIDLTASPDPSAGAKEVHPPSTRHSPSPHPTTSHSPPSRPKPPSPIPPP